MDDEHLQEGEAKFGCKDVKSGVSCRMLSFKHDTGCFQVLKDVQRGVCFQSGSLQSWGEFGSAAALNRWGPKGGGSVCSSDVSTATLPPFTSTVFISLSLLLVLWNAVYFISLWLVLSSSWWDSDTWHLLPELIWQPRLKLSKFCNVPTTHTSTKITLFFYSCVTIYQGCECVVQS